MGGGGEGFLNKHNQQLETCIIESIITDILQRIFIIISIKKILSNPGDVKRSIYFNLLFRFSVSNYKIFNIKPNMYDYSFVHYKYHMFGMVYYVQCAKVQYCTVYMYYM